MMLYSSHYSCLVIQLVDDNLSAVAHKEHFFMRLEGSYTSALDVVKFYKFFSLFVDSLNGDSVDVALLSAIGKH